MDIKSRLWIKRIASNSLIVSNDYNKLIRKINQVKSKGRIIQKCLSTESQLKCNMTDSQEVIPKEPEITEFK